MIEHLRECLDYDPATGALTWRARDEAECVHNRRWNTKYAGKPALRTVSPNGYMKGGVKGKTLLAHRVIWAIVHGEWPEQIDHINGDKLDNRLCNLRSVTASLNQKNRKMQKNNKSGQMGVCWEKDRNKWRADVTVMGKTITLGRFLSKEDAIAARKAAEAVWGHHQNHGRS